MLTHYNTIISDTSCLILLSKIGELNILRKLFGNVSITKTIADEFGDDLPEFFSIIDNRNDKLLKILELDLDKGEASAIALALESDTPLLIIDDMKGRKMCTKLHLKLTGTMGILLKAVQLGIVTNSHELVAKIQSTNFRVPNDILNLFLK